MSNKLTIPVHDTGKRPQTGLLVIFLGILTLIASGWVLYVAQSVFLPLVVAWLLSYIFGPVVQFLKKYKIPPNFSVFLVLLLLLCVFYLAFIFIYGRIGRLAQVYQSDYSVKLDGLVATLSSQWQMDYNPFKQFDWVHNLGRTLMTASGTAMTFVMRLVMVLIFLVFLLLGKPHFEDKVRFAFSPEKADHIIHILGSISRQIGQYLGLQFLISLFTGFMVWAALRIINVDFPITWGMLAFFLNFIPTLGSIIASIPPIVLALVQFYPNYVPVIITAVAMIAIQMTIGNVLAPKILGDKLNLSPVVVLLSLVFWGWLWGPVGALLSVPLAAAMKIVCENVDILSPIAIMMSSGRRFSPAKRSAAN